jgi:OFA family oxalate/formate antiporter-like MFS transporter
MSGLAFFGWGAVFSLFPAVSCDMFGRQFATTNYSLLYTAKGVASGIVAAAVVIRSQTGSWSGVFVVMIAADAVASLLALFVLRPLRRHLANVEALVPVGVRAEESV